MSTQFINDQWRLPNAWNGSESNVNKQSNYSMDFDGSQHISFGSPSSLLTTGAFSVSWWMKTTVTANDALILMDDYSAGNRNWQIVHLLSGNVIRFYVFGSPSAFVLANTSINDGNWHHVVCTYEPSTALRIYIDGSLDNTNTTSIPATRNNSAANLRIGRDDFNQRYTGSFDGVSIFNYVLSSSQITTLYGSSSTGIGNPMSLSPKPVAYYPLGDQDAFNGANYLVPNIAAQEDDGDIATSYSPYALDFDGANDYIDCGSDSSLTPTTAFSVSCWVYLNATGTQTILHNGGGNNDGYILYFIGSYLRFYIREGSSWRYFNSDNAFVANTWYNVTTTWDGSTMKMYINNALQSNTATASSISINTHFRIGVYGGGSNILNGRLSNVSVWNSELTSSQVTEIYNEGVPSNLNNHSAYSNLISWWQLGSNSSFNTNWTVLDEKGSNNGTSVNMDEVDIVDGVGSYANGLSSGMGGDEVIGDAPYSSSNSLSVNMDVLDRVEDTPS